MKTKSEKKDFKLYVDSLQVIKKMTDEEAGQFLRKCLSFWEEEKIEVDRIIELSFESTKAQFERDWKNYQSICERNKENGLKPKKPVAPSRSQSTPSEADTDKDTDKDKDKEKKKLYEETFNFFWEMYPNKKSKKDSIRIWNKLKMTEELYRKIIYSLQEQMNSKQWTKQSGEFIPHPSSWLNQERWNDEEVTPPVDLELENFLNSMKK